MGNKYEWNINPFQDFLLASLLYNTDITDKELEIEIYVAFSSLLNYIASYSEKELELLDFDIKKRKNKFMIIGNNFISALWLSGIFPENPKQIINKNEYLVDNKNYKFNTKTKKLTYKIIKK